MADILIPKITWNSDSNDVVSGNGTAVSAEVPSIAQRRVEILSQGTDTFTRQFSSSAISPLTDPQIANESQILTHLDRLQPKPNAQRRLGSPAMLSVLVVPVAIVTYLLVQRSFAVWQPAVEWLVQSYGVGQVKRSEAQRELNGDASDSGAANRTVVTQSNQDRTGNDLSSSGSAPSSAATPSPPNVVALDPQGQQVAGASTQSAIALQGAIADGSSDVCGPKQAAEGDQTATYGPTEFLALAQIGRNWRPRMWLRWRWLYAPKANKNQPAATSGRVTNAASHPTNPALFPLFR